jgi:hypothetical protein
MNDEEYEKLSTIARQLISMTFVLKSYCEYFEQNIPEFAKLSDFAVILDEVSNKLFDIL